MKDYRFRKKIIWMNATLIISISMVLGILVYSYLVRISNRNFEEQLAVKVSSAGTYIKETMDRADEVALQLAANRHIITLFQEMLEEEQKQNYFVDNPVADKSLKQFMHSYILKKNTLGRVCLFDAKKNFTFVGSAVDYSYVEEKGLDEKFVTYIQDYFTNTQQATLYQVYQSDPFSESKKAMITVTREIRDYLLVPSTTLGYVQVHIPLNNLKKFFGEIQGSGESYILDANTRKVLFASNISARGQELIEHIAQPIKEKDLMYQDGYYIKSQLLEYVPLQIVIMEENIDIVHYAMTTLGWMGVFMASITFLVILTQAQVVKRSTAPIVELYELVEKVDIHQETLHIPLIIPEESNELRQLNYAFSNLIENLKWSMDKQMSSQINEARAHLFALQSQMNPHFIHNILFVISAMSQVEEYDRIPSVCEKLSDLIRYNTSYEDTYVTIQEELDHAINYLELMKLRYEEKFQYTISYIGGDLNTLIPKFIFQPIIENSFQHAFKEKAFPWSVQLMIYADSTHWRVVLQDNGKGMAENELALLRNTFVQIQKMPLNQMVSELKIGGLSLKNTYSRLYLCYEDEMIFNIHSEEEQGTKIVLGGSSDDKGNGC